MYLYIREQNSNNTFTNPLLAYNFTEKLLLSFLNGP